MSDQNGHESTAAGSGGGGDGEGNRGKHSVLTPDRLKRYRERLIDAAILGLPIAGINWGLQRISTQLGSEPWHILWFIVPLAAATWLLWRQVMRREDFRVRGRMLLFLICYLLIFTLAAGSNLLVWKRSTVTVNEGSTPRNWLLPAGWGDWRYHFARRPPQVQRLVVLVIPEPPPATTLAERRMKLAQVIALAVRDSAIGVAFDYYFGKERTGVDGLVCSAITRADSAHIPVIVGQRVVRRQSGLDAEDYADSIEPCVPADRRAYLLGYRDADGVLRHVVLRAHLITRGTAPLSLKVAELLVGGRKLQVDTSGELLQFVEPDSLQLLQYGKVSAGELKHWLKGRFLLVGQRSGSETFHTPYGDQLGVQVHAAAIASLVAGAGIDRPPWWSGVLVILAACYLMTVLAADGLSAPRLLALALGISTFVVVAAALAMRLWQVWLDVVYPLVALWVLLGLLLLLRKRLGTGEHTLGRSSGRRLSVEDEEG